MGWFGCKSKNELELEIINKNLEIAALKEKRQELWATVTRYENRLFERDAVYESWKTKVVERTDAEKATLQAELDMYKTFLGKLNIKV